MDETINLLIAFLSGPVFLGAIAAIWYYFTKVREPARMKEAAISSASAREKDRSLQVFGETQAGRAQDRSNDIQDKLVAFLLASNDGKISEILNTNKEGTAQVVNLIMRTDAGQSEQGRLIIASQNQLIVLLSKFLDNISEVSAADYGLALQIKEASIDSAEVQQARGVATAAVTGDLGEVMATIEVEGKKVE